RVRLGRLPRLRLAGAARLHRWADGPLRRRSRAGLPARHRPGAGLARRARSLAHRARARAGALAARGPARPRAGLAPRVLCCDGRPAHTRARPRARPDRRLRPRPCGMRRARLPAAVAGPGREAALVALLLLLIRPALLPDPRPAVGSLNDDAIYVALGRA